LLISTQLAHGGFDGRQDQLSSQPTAWKGCFNDRLEPAQESAWSRFPGRRRLWLAMRDASDQLAVEFCDERVNGIGFFG
jgi:hypothetical protein